MTSPKAVLSFLKLGKEVADRHSFDTPFLKLGQQFLVAGDVLVPTDDVGCTTDDGRFQQYVISGITA